MLDYILEIVLDYILQVYYRNYRLPLINYKYIIVKLNFIHNEHWAVWNDIQSVTLKVNWFFLTFCFIVFIFEFVLCAGFKYLIVDKFLIVKQTKYLNYLCRVYVLYDVHFTWILETLRVLYISANIQLREPGLKSHVLCLPTIITLGVLEYKDLILEYEDLILEYNDLVFEYKDLILEYNDLVFEYKDLILEYEDWILENKYLILEYMT